MQTMVETMRRSLDFQKNIYTALSKIFHFLYYFTPIYRNLKEPGATERSEVVKENDLSIVIPSSEHPVDVWEKNLILVINFN